MAHWCFDTADNPARDCSEAGYDGYYMGSLRVVEGRVGNAGTFDGETWIEVPSPFFLDGLCQATVSAFLRLEEKGPQQQILGGGDVRGGTDPLSFQLSDGAMTNVGFEDTDADLRMKADWEVNGQLFDSDRWYHLAVTLERAEKGSRMVIYVDGEVVEEVERSAPRCIAYDVPMPTQIGAIHGSQTWRGQLDELRIYNRALSADEVALLAR